MFSNTEARLLTTIVRVPFVLVELILRTLLALIVAIKNAIVSVVSKLDRKLSALGKWRASRGVIDESLIVFVTTQKEYGCNPKYIADEFIRRGRPYRLVWAVDDRTRGPFPQELNFVVSGTSEYFTTLGRARVIIQNGHSLQLQGVVKNDSKQLWLQTWHGSLGIKKLEGAGGDDRLFENLKKRDRKQTDFLISNSDFEDNVFDSSYWPSVPIKRLGHARNDILYDKSAETAAHMRNKVLTRLRIKDTGQRFLLFAPTHDEENVDQPFGHLDFEALGADLTAKFGGQWEFIVRSHNRNKRSSVKWFKQLPGYCHNGSFYPDIQELMVVADVGLTDYSSWIFDFLTTRKPGFLYGANLSTYSQNRGFYYGFDETPFSLAETKLELGVNIANFNPTSYDTKIDDFFARRGLTEDATSASKIVDFIETLAPLPMDSH
jgi:CDP-glycerol glycerophosphotransferase